MKQISEKINNYLNVNIRTRLDNMFLYQYPTKINIMSRPQENILSDVCIINLRTLLYENFR